MKQVKNTFGKWQLPENPPIKREGDNWYEPARSVIVTDIHNKVYVGFYVFQNKDFYWKDTDHPIEIKAWMDLPFPYGQEENEKRKWDKGWL